MLNVTPMASDKKWVLQGIPPGGGRALDLGGGNGELFLPLNRRGYSYVNVDLHPSGQGELVVGDAHDLPFPAESFDLVVSSDSLEHFHSPSVALREAARVLKPGGRLVAWVPFMHPFHGDDYYRYTPLGLRHLLEETGFCDLSISAPHGVFTILAGMLAVVLGRVGLGRLERPLKHVGASLDRRLRYLHKGDAYAAAYLVTGCRM
jgi:SAM-dependent methyltransferase